MVAAMARPLSVPLTAAAAAEALGAMAGEGLAGILPPMGGAAGAVVNATKDAAAQAEQAQGSHQNWGLLFFFP